MWPGIIVGVFPAWRSAVQQAANSPLTALEREWQSAAGKAVIIFCKMAPGKSFAPSKSQNFKPRNKSWLIAQADPVARTVTSVFNEQGEQKPFTAVLAELLQCVSSRWPKTQRASTFGVKVGDEYFIRSVAKIDAEGVHFFCDLEFGDRLHLLEETDFKQATLHDWKNFITGRGKPAAILMNDCILRRLGSESHLHNAHFFKGLPAAGFSSWRSLAFPLIRRSPRWSFSIRTSKQWRISRWNMHDMPGITHSERCVVGRH
jgi:hypothetical protein